MGTVAGNLLAASSNPVQAFFEQAQDARQRERAALWCAGRTIDYGTLAGRVARVAGWIAASRPSAGARVGVLGGRSAAAATAVLGCTWAGVTYVPLGVKHPAARLDALLARAELHALLVDAEGLQRLQGGELPHAPTAVVVPEDGALASTPLAEPAVVEGEHVAYIMFTSGTTGAPKGVMVTAGNVSRFLQEMPAFFDIGPGDRCSQFYELNFDVSVFDLFFGLGRGASLYMLSDKDRLTPVRFIQEHALDLWCSVPSAATLARRTGQLKPGSLPSLRHAMFCGEALPGSVAEAWRAAAPQGVLDCHYGPTETTIVCTGFTCDPEIKLTPERGCVSIGKAYGGMLAALVDEQQRFLPPGAAGELAFSGPLVSAGYFRDAALTARRYPTLHHPQYGTRRWYLTGDLARLDEQGDYHHLGRVDNQVKVLGHRIELEDVDNNLRQVAGSELAACVAWPLVDGAAQGLVAFVSGSALSATEIGAALRERLPPTMTPRRVVLLPSMPLSANGKLDRRALLDLLESQAV